METWPNFLIVGSEKSGTTSLHRYLREHPDIYMAPVKEPAFFNHALDRAADAGPEARRAATAEYLALFEDAHDHPVRGEATPTYLTHPRAPERIHRHAPDARVVACLRDPVERAYSHYRMQVRIGKEDRPFLEAVKAERAAEAAGRPAKRYVTASRYHEHLQRYVDALGRDRVLICLFHNLKKRPHHLLGRVARFLDVPPEPLEAVDTTKVHNAAKTPRGPVARFLRHDPRVQRAARRVLPRELREFLGERVLYRPVEKPPMDPEAVAILWDAFEPEVRGVEKLLGRPLPELRHTHPAKA